MSLVVRGPAFRKCEQLGGQISLYIFFSCLDSLDSHVFIM